MFKRRLQEQGYLDGKLYIDKTIHVDFKEITAGKFLQIAEISNDRKSAVVIPSSGIGAFLATLQR